MTKPNRDRFAVSRSLASFLGLAWGTVGILAILLVAAAQLWTCFAPPHEVDPAVGQASVILPDSSNQQHDLIIGILQNTWELAGERRSISVAIVKSQDINAASLGNGHFILWEGVATLPIWGISGIMSHEVAHDILAHTRRSAELADVLEVVAEFTNVVGQAEYDAGQTVQRWARNAVLPTYSRDQEYQADSLAATLLAFGGVDGPRTMAATLELLVKRYGDTGGGLLDHHPSTSDRIAALLARSQQRAP